MSGHHILALVLLGLFILFLVCYIEIAWWIDSYKERKEYPCLSPATLKRSTKMNWVGCILTWLALGIVSPIVFAFKCIYNLFHI